MIGVKTTTNLKVDFVDVEFGSGDSADKPEDQLHQLDPAHPNIRRSQSRAFLTEDGQPQPMQVFNSLTNPRYT